MKLNTTIWHKNVWNLALLVICTFLMLLPADLTLVNHRYDSMSQIMNNVRITHPNITKLYSIGKSVRGRELWVMLLSKNPSDESTLKPNVKLIANMHGNEAVGKEVLLELILFLVQKYNNNDPEVTYLMENTMIHIMPTLNPDGYEDAVEGWCTGKLGRFNTRGIDLNRNFPDFFRPSMTKPIQPETEAIINWLQQTTFSLSGNFHGGALVVSYPYDNIPLENKYNFSPTKLGPKDTENLTPDDDTFKHLALVYSMSHTVMPYEVICRKGVPSFENGTTNGAAWYPITGSMQDYNYIYGGCLEITIEMSCCKYPKESELPAKWNENINSILAFIKAGQEGVRGYILNSITKKPVKEALLNIKSRDSTFSTSKYGSFWRVLRPGRYTLQANLIDYQPIEIDFEVTSSGPTELNLEMNPMNWPGSTGGRPGENRAVVVTEPEKITYSTPISASDIKATMTKQVTNKFKQPPADNRKKYNSSSICISSICLTFGILIFTMLIFMQ